MITSISLTLVAGCTEKSEPQKFAEFVKKHTSKVRPLSKKSRLAYWAANTTGEEKYFEQMKDYRLKISEVYSNEEKLEYLKGLKESAVITDSELARHLELLYLGYLGSKIPDDLREQMAELDVKIRHAFNTYRAMLDGEKVTMSDIYIIMTDEEDLGKRERAWRASKQVGAVVAEDLLSLIRLRNEAAKKVGFDNFHTMNIVTGEQDVAELDAIFAELEEKTREPFAKMKGELDKILAKGYGVEVSDLRPWHYHDPFFQRTPLVFELDLDIYYEGRDVKDLSEEYYAGIGMEVGDILSRSDLYDKEGKNPHAFSCDVDREGDVRILCNLQNTERWMETQLHELGHAAYSKYHDMEMSWSFRRPAHSFTTEGIAMFFGRMSRNAAWMEEMLSLSKEDSKKVGKVSDKYTRFQQVLFARWAMVMYNFEKQLYVNPEQDLDKLWWDMVEKYQFMNRPEQGCESGWASKLHFVGAPCYYHNYLLGELFASQVHYYVAENVLGVNADESISYIGDERLGEYLKEKVLGPGCRYHWNEMIERATGEKLSPKYFVKQFIK